MKAIPYLPAGLLLLLCVLNLYLGFITRPENGFIMYLVFGVVYFSMGVLLVKKIRFAELAGFIISFALLFIYPLMVDFHNLHPWSSGIMGAINAIVVIGCLYLLMIEIKN